MVVVKDKQTPGQWVCRFYYKDHTGSRKEKFKRGFKTKREGQEWEREWILLHDGNLAMSFEKFVEVYFEDIKPRRKTTTFLNRQTIIGRHITPYFGQKSIADITIKDVSDWQNLMLSMKQDSGKPYSATYLRTLNSSLSAIFNHAVKYYNLASNPVSKAGVIGSKRKEKISFLTFEEFQKMLSVMNPKDPYDNQYIVIFKIAMFSGLRQGEIMALTYKDFKVDQQGKPYISVSKSYAKVAGTEIIQKPKTESSIRDVYIPQSLKNDVDEYISHLYAFDPDEQLFKLHKATLNRKLHKCCEKAGVKQITFHDLRHSFASMVINQGIQFQVLQQMLGHSTPTETLNTYSHLYPNSQDKVVDLINRLNA